MLRRSGLDVPEHFYSTIISYTFTKSPNRIASMGTSSLIFYTIYKDLEVLLDIPDIEAVTVFNNYNIIISFLGFYSLYLYEGVLTLYDFDNELSRVVKDKDLADKCTIVSEVLLHSILNSDPPDEVLYTLRKRIVSLGLPLYNPNKELRFF